MISEYHVNLILKRLDAIIENQNKTLDLLKGNCGRVVQAPVEKLEISLPENFPREEPGVKTRSTAAFKTDYQKYKADGGKLSWNAWLKSGRPATD